MIIYSVTSKPSLNFCELLFKLLTKMTNLVPFPHTKGNEKSTPKTPGLVLNKTEDFNNIVVMSGSAKRRRLETEESPAVKIIQKDFREKLRAPFYKSHHKQEQNGERVMTKSCELLLECIKPYKEIRVAKRTQVTESTRTIASILTTDVVYERKATRKVEFVQFRENHPLETIFTQKPKPSPLLPVTDTTSVLQSGDELNLKDFLKTENKQNQTGKAVSSEDFITKVFTDTDSLFM